MNVAAAAAAAAIAEMMRQEEEELTEYTDEELNEDWEFKILRSSTLSFRRQDIFQEVLREEERAGWIMVEKFDDRRIRFKRPVSARQNDRTLDFDPYRTTHGTPQAAIVLIILGVSFGILAFFIVLGLLFG
jgi:hypothetical protein